VVSLNGPDRGSFYNGFCDIKNFKLSADKKAVRVFLGTKNVSQNQYLEAFLKLINSLCFTSFISL